MHHKDTHHSHHRVSAHLPSFAFDISSRPWHIVDPKPPILFFSARRFAAWAAHCENLDARLRVGSC
jgi:hypothetical protein